VLASVSSSEPTPIFCPAIGDAIVPGGNDYPAKQAGVTSICVRDHKETKRVVEAIVACLNDATPANTQETDDE
jgi:hypothetical protein